MQLELIKNKVYYKIFDKEYKASTGIYSKYKHQNDASKLCEVSDNIKNIKSDYNAKNIVILKQVHGNEVIDEDVTDCSNYPEADGSITTNKNVILSVLTADCVPVLFSSSDGDIIGAAHCGWRSAKANIISNVNNMMKAKGAKDIKAIIGPSIQQASYEVDSGFYNDFIEDDNSYKDLFIASKNTNRYMFDISGYVQRKIEKENIELVHHIKDDTYAMNEKYPSYRRSFHKGGTHSQGILSTIMIRSDV